jgi:hypothetical protein
MIAYGPVKIRISAIVKRLAAGGNDNNILLQSNKGQNVSLNPAALGRPDLHDILEKGSIVDCEVTQVENRNSFWVTRVFSTTPPEPSTPAA